MPNVADLILEWEKLQSVGEVDCLERLCAQFPEQAKELRTDIEMLQSVDRLLELDDSETDSEADRLDGSDFPRRLANYEIRGVIGRGGMGVVLEAWDTSLPRPVAPKTVHTKWPPWCIVDQEKLNGQFARECQLLAQLRHQHIVTVYTTFREDGQPYLVMEMLRGGTLAAHRDDLIQRGTGAILTFVEKVARAVDHAHKNDILHRDLKPSNIFLDENGEPKVGDFGLAKSFSAVDGPAVDGWIADRQAAEGDWCSSPFASLLHEAGTAPWMSPERLYGPPQSEVTRAADIWALGVILYELLTGRRPYEGATRLEIAAAISRGPPLPVRRLAPRISRRLENLVQRCLVLDPKSRIQDAGALADELANLRKPRYLVLKRIAALAAAAVVPIALVLTFSSTEAEKILEKYHRDSAGLLTQLQKNQSVELVGPNLSPVYYVREGGGATEVAPSADGLSIFAPALSLVELLPDVPAEQYHIEAQIEQVASHHPELGFVGLYCKGAHFATKSLRGNVVYLVRFSDTNRGARHKVKSVINCFVFNKEFGDGGFPYQAAEWMNDGFAGRYSYDIEPPGQAPKMRFLNMDVSEAGVIGAWESGQQDGIQKTFGPLDEKLLIEQFSVAQQPGPGQIRGLEKVDLLSIISSRAVGVFVSCSHCLVRKVKISLVPHTAKPNQ